MATLGRYELRGTLGEGGFATVYRAFDPALGREVALKALHPHLAANVAIRRRFLDEARALARLRHAHIVTVHDVGEAGGRPFFAMELIEGRTLADLAPGQALPPGQVTSVITSLADALDELHRAGLVHRDIKAANVMVDRGGRVVLMDLGIARVLDGTQHTQTGAVLGTLESMAPEQVRGQPVGPPADIYALGILTYQLLAGRPPFVGDTASLLHAHVYDPPPPLAQVRPGLPPHIYAAVAAALAKEPERRPATAGRFAAMLAGTAPPMAAGGRGQTPPAERRAPATPLPLTEVTRPRSGRSALPLVGVALAAAMIVGAIVVGVLLTIDRDGPARDESRAGGVLPPTGIVATSTAIADILTPQPETPAPTITISGFAVRNIDGWSQGRGSLQGCYGYRDAHQIWGLRLRVSPQGDDSAPADSVLLNLPAAAGELCNDLPAAGVVRPGVYLARLYDDQWQERGSYGFTVQAPPTPVTPTSPMVRAQDIGVTHDAPGCCQITVRRAEASADALRLSLSFRMVTPGWTSDAAPATISRIALTDERGRRSELREVTGAAARDDPNAVTIDGVYRFAAPAGDARWVWLHYPAGERAARSASLGIDLGSASPAAAGSSPPTATIGASGNEPDCCRITVERVESLGGGVVRLHVSFVMTGTFQWKGDNRPEYRTTIYLVDGRGRRSNLESVTGPSASDNDQAIKLSGWYRFAPLAAGTQRVRLHYGDGTVEFSLGAAAPR
jgi:serine/threonine-protein kinase